MTFSLTLNRRNPDGSLLQRKFIISPVEERPYDDQELALLMFDFELQANSLVLESPRPLLRVWIEESHAA